jgi:hypothetical protein
MINRLSGEWQARCDCCKALFMHRDGNTIIKTRQPDHLTERMRKRGWKTSKGKNIGDPLMWACPECQKEK